MLTKLLGVLAVFVFAYSFKNKMYRYALIPVLLIMYELASDPNQYIVFNLTSPNAIGLAEKAILILMSVLLWIWSGREKEGRNHWGPALFGTVACALRFVRSIAFDWFTSQMKEPGADVIGIHQTFTSCFSIIDTLTKIVIVVMLASILRNLSHSKQAEI